MKARRKEDIFHFRTSDLISIRWLRMGDNARAMKHIDEGGGSIALEELVPTTGSVSTGLSEGSVLVD